MQRRTRRFARVAACGGAGAAALVLALAACSTSPDEGSPVAGERAASDVHVVATTTVLGDVVGRVVTCAGGSVETLMPVGADPHDFSPSSSAIRSLVEADLVVANGLGLEEGLETALASAVDDGAVVLEVAPLLDPIPFGADGEDHADDDHADDDHADDDPSRGDHADDVRADDDHVDDEHDHGSDDPHVWLDVARMADAAALIGVELTRTTGDAAFEECGTSVAEDLAAVDLEVREILDVVPEGDRILVTDHDAFGYFAAAYDFEVIGVVVPGGSTLAEPSSSALADLAGSIRRTGAPAVFVDVLASRVLVDALADEVGDVAVVPLYVGSLGAEGSEASDYPSMMLTNARLVADALNG